MEKFFAGSKNLDTSAVGKKEPAPPPGKVFGDPKIRDGVRVIIFGMNSLPELNNGLGTVTTWSDKSGRWKVRLDVDEKYLSSSGKLLELREKNIAVYDEASKCQVV